jgi:hypothetical protein
MALKYTGNIPAFSGRRLIVPKMWRFFLVSRRVIVMVIRVTPTEVGYAVMRENA